MREIKFRAWYDGRWHQPALVGGTQVPQVFDSKSNLVNLCSHTEDYYVCQYTGLQDKNGVDIYEGDMVLVTGQDDELVGSDHGVGSVVWLSDWGIWYIENQINNGLGDICYQELVEVIGNIYENPELLRKAGDDTRRK